MASKQVDPNDVIVSEFNERQSFTADELGELVDSVKQSGVIEPPQVTETEDGQYAAYVGQRRVAAAKQAGLDEITVIVNDVSDEEALIASITENTGLFSEDVSPGDRAQAIQTLWELMGGSGTPVFSHVAGKLGLSADTVRTWFEPMREEWKDTAIDPTTLSDDDDDSDFFSGEHSLGERSLGEVRRMSSDTDEMEKAAMAAAELGATQDDLSEAKELSEERGLPADKAIEDIVGGSEPERTMNVSIQFGEDITTEVEELAESRDQEPETIIREAVEYYLDDQAQSQRPEPKAATQTLSDSL